MFYFVQLAMNVVLTASSEAKGYFQCKKEYENYPSKMGFLIHSL